MQNIKPAPRPQATLPGDLDWFDQHVAHTQIMAPGELMAPFTFPVGPLPGHATQRGPAASGSPSEHFAQMSGANPHQGSGNAGAAKSQPASGLNSALTAAASGLKINLIWDASVAAAPASFKTAVQNAANMLMQAFSNAITLNFNVGWGEIGGRAITQPGVAEGGPSTGDWQSFAAVKSELAATASSPLDTSVLAYLGAQNPNGNGSIAVWRAQEKALGIVAANATAADGDIGFSTDFPSTSWTGAALHELTHAMGRTSGYAPDGILDLMRYSAPGVHTYAGGTPAYFSINGGKTDLANFSTSSDYGDFATDALTRNDPNNAFISPGSNTLTEVDLELMDAIGFTRTTSVGAALADMVVSSVQLSPTRVARGANVSLSYTEADIGKAAALASTTQVLIDGKLVVSNQIGALSSGGSVRVTDLISTAGMSSGMHTFKIIADALNGVTESNELNNTFTSTFRIA